MDVRLSNFEYYLVHIGNGMLLYVFFYLEPRDIYKFFQINNLLKGECESNIIWKVLYHQKYVSNNDNNNRIYDEIRYKLRRPYYEDTIGWFVVVTIYDEVHKTTTKKSGVVMEYRSNDIAMATEYLIQYENLNGEGNELIWEQENVSRSEYWNESKSRIDFIRPSVQERHTKNDDNKANNQTSKYAQSYPHDSLNVDSWHHHFKTRLLHLPCRHTYTLSWHKDEVLYCAFDKSGKYLAACSRDGSVSITQFDGTGHTVTAVHILHIASARHAEHALWSPGGKYLILVSSHVSLHGDEPYLEIFETPRSNSQVATIVPATYTPINSSSLWLSDTQYLYLTRVQVTATNTTMNHLSIANLSSQSFKFHLELPSYFVLPQRIKLRHLPDDTPSLDHLAIAYVTASTRDADSNLLCILPLHNILRIKRTSYLNYPHVNTYGAVVGLLTHSSAPSDKYLYVNVRPYVMNKDRGYDAIPDISEDVELRLYDVNTLQYTHKFMDHMGFTLKTHAFFLYLDMQTMCPVDSGIKNDACKEEDEKCGNISEERVERGAGQDFMVASASEDNNVYVWDVKGSYVDVNVGHNGEEGNRKGNVTLFGGGVQGQESAGGEEAREVLSHHAVQVCVDVVVYDHYANTSILYMHVGVSNGGLFTV